MGMKMSVWVMAVWMAVGLVSAAEWPRDRGERRDLYQRRRSRRAFDAEGSTEAATIAAGRRKRRCGLCSEVRHGGGVAKNRLRA